MTAAPLYHQAHPVITTQHLADPHIDCELSCNHLATFTTGRSWLMLLPHPGLDRLAGVARNVTSD